MKAVVFHDAGDILLEDVPEPRLEQPTDAITQLTASAICGTDLHFIRRTFPGMRDGTILGHECVGIIEQVGEGVRNFAVGVDAECPHHEPAAKQAWAEAGISGRTAKDCAETKCRGRQLHPGQAPSQAQQWPIQALAKAGTLSIIGVYPPNDTSFPIGMAMNKSITVKMGNCNHRKYIPKLLELARNGSFNPEALTRPASSRSLSR